MSFDLIVTKHLAEAAKVTMKALEQKQSNSAEATKLIEENEALRDWLKANTKGRKVKVLSISRAAQWYVVSRIHEVLNLVVEDKVMVKAIMADLAFAIAGQTGSASSHISVAKKEFSDITFE